MLCRAEALTVRALLRANTRVLTRSTQIRRARSGHQRVCISSQRQCRARTISRSHAWECERVLVRVSRRRHLLRAGPPSQHGRVRVYVT